MSTSVPDVCFDCRLPIGGTTKRLILGDQVFHADTCGPSPTSEAVDKARAWDELAKKNAQIASLTAENERLKEQYSFMSKASAQHLADAVHSGAKLTAAEATIERLKAALGELLAEARVAGRVSQATFRAARATLQSTEGSGEIGEPR